MTQPVTDNILEIRDFCLGRQVDDTTRPVLDDIRLTLRRGGVLGLVGESGSGKSTLAATLLGYTWKSATVTSGTVSVAGADVFALSGRELRRLRSERVALVPQNAGAALTPTMRIADQLGEVLRLHADRFPTAASRRRRMAEVLRAVRLPDVPGALGKYPHQFSGGQQQRIGIAMALCATPDLLVLDEPTTGLDVVTQAAILDNLRVLQTQIGMSMVLVSHDLAVVDLMCTDVAVMRRGRIVEFGAVREVLRHPSHPYTRGLIASVPRISAPGIPPSLDNAAIDAYERGAAPEPRPQPVYVRRPARSRDVVLQARELSVDYARRPTPGRGKTVTGVSFDIHRGEVLALVGESGSGKSTIANAIAGLVALDSGTLTLTADDGPTRLRPSVGARPKSVRQAIQSIFQNADTSLNPRRTVGQAIARPMRLFRVKGKSVGQALADVELPGHFAERLPGQMSGGQRQRVGIARAVGAAPTVVLADEIVSALDVSVQSSVLRLTDSLVADKDLSFLFITHDLAVVRSIADRVLVLYLGRMVEEGAVDDVFGPTNHPYTRMLRSAGIELGQTHPAPGAGQTVDDEVPAAPPTEGCPFVSRCPWVMDVCRHGTPPIRRISDTHTIACHLTASALTDGTLPPRPGGTVGAPPEVTVTEEPA